MTKQESILEIVGEEIKRFTTEVINEHNSHGELETWYRGYDSQYGSERNHLLWVADNEEYAEEYGDTVDEVTIDRTKLRIAPLHKLDEILGYEFDRYDGPDEEETRKLVENGYNAYEFMTPEAHCMCLWNDEPIVETRTIIKKA